VTGEEEEQGVLAGRTVISVAQRPDVIHRSAAMVGVLHNGTLAEWYSIYLLYQYKRTKTDLKAAAGARLSPSLPDAGFTTHCSKVPR
jgi:hypothetical protein